MQAARARLSGVWAAGALSDSNCASRRAAGAPLPRVTVERGRAARGGGSTVNGGMCNTGCGFDIVLAPRAIRTVRGDTRKASVRGPYGTNTLRVPYLKRRFLLSK